MARWRLGGPALAAALALVLAAGQPFGGRVMSSSGKRLSQDLRDPGRLR